MKELKKEGIKRRHYFHNLRDEYKEVHLYMEGTNKNIKNRYWVKKFDSFKGKEVRKIPMKILIEFKKNGIRF